MRAHLITNLLNKTISLILMAAMLLTAAGSLAEDEWQALSAIAELFSADGEISLTPGDGLVMQRDLHQETLNNVEISIREAIYDGRSLLLCYSYRMTDVDIAFGAFDEEDDAWVEESEDSPMEEAEPEENEEDEEEPDGGEDMDSLLLAHNVGWWTDQLWINGQSVDMPGGSSQSTRGTEVPGEILAIDCWRLDAEGVFLNGSVQISLPIGLRMEFEDYNQFDHPELYKDDRMILPEQNVVTFTLDVGDIQSGLRVFHPDRETALPECTAKVREAVFTPMMTYITMDIAVNQAALDAFIAENGEEVFDEEGNVIWINGPMDVISPWVSSLTLTDGTGTPLFPAGTGECGFSEDRAEFVCPPIAALPDELYLAPVDEEDTVDLSRAVPLLPARP